jgi:hypothetical protein
MQSWLTYFAALVAILATLPYIIDVVRGKTKPNVVTWATWSLLNLITVIAALAVNAWQTAVFAGAIGACTALIAVLGIKRGVRKYTPFDFVCQVLALAAIFAWWKTNDPAWAILFTIAGSFIGSLPTVRHAWLKPREETWQFFAADAFAAALAILSVSEVMFVTVGFAIYILLSDLLIMGVILVRLKTK